MPHAKTPERTNTGAEAHTGKPPSIVHLLEEAAEAVSHLACIVETSDDSIISKTLDGTILTWNSGAQRIYGYTAEEAVGRPITILIPDGHEEEMPDTLEAIRRGERIDHFETKRVRKDGVLIDVSLTVSPIRNAKGEITGASSIARDITDRKRAEQALAWESDINRAMADLSGALLASAQIDDISIRVLAHAKSLTSSKYGFVGYIDPETGFWIPTTMSYNVWDECLVENKKLVFRKFGGMWGWVLDNREPLMTNSPALDERSTGVPEGHVPIERFLAAPAMLGDELVGMVALANPVRDYEERDMSAVKRLAEFYALAVQRMRAEQELAQRAESLARSNGDLQQFAYVASHDLQEPLRMVASYVRLLQQRYQDKLDEDANTFIDYAVDGASRMQDLITGLLDYSRVSACSEPFAPVECEAALDAALANLRVSIDESGAVVTHDPLPTVTGDRLQITQLLQNLIGNAVKYRGTDPPRVHVSCQREEDGCVFCVRDNGVGIAPENRERIFRMFERIGTESQRAGTGIGLAVCKRIVERHGGRIWVESEAGRGSMFCFSIPER